MNESVDQELDTSNNADAEAQQIPLNSPLNTPLASHTEEEPESTPKRRGRGWPKGVPRGVKKKWKRTVLPKKVLPKQVNMSTSVIMFECG